MIRFLRTLWRRRTIDRDLQDEIDDHVARDVDYRIRHGATPQEAVREARARFGSAIAAADGVRDVRGLTGLDDIGRDLRLAWRRMRRAPGWSSFVIGTIGLGVGATTAIFTVVHGVLWRPLPYRDPDALVTIWQARPSVGAEREDVAPANFLDLEARARSFAALAAGNPYSVNLRGRERTDNVEAWQVSEGFFRLLDREPALGRALRPEDFGAGSAPVAVLDHGFWMSRFGGRRDVVGTSILIDEVPATVIGVMPAGVTLPAPAALWMPWIPDTAQARDRFGTYIRVFGRLASGVTATEAAAELSALGAQLASEWPRANRGVEWRVVGLRELLVGGRGPLLFTLLVAALLLLVVTLANVAALQLTRLARYRQESAVRAALGASRGRLVRPAVVEGAWLALCGGIVGLALAWLGVQWFHRLAPSDLPRLDAIRLDAGAAGATALLSLLAAFILSLLGVRGISADARPGAFAARGSTGGRGALRLRRFSVAFQIGVAVVLLVGTGLLVRSFVAVVNAERGYRTEGMLSFTTWVYGEYPDIERRRLFVESVLEQMGALPGVRAVSVGSALPLADAITGTRADIIMPGAAVTEGEEPQADAAVVWPTWFQTLGIAVRRGRGLLSTDDARAEPVVVVNEAFARSFSPGEEIVGRTVSVGLMGRARPRRVVGVVADTRHARLDAPPGPAVYIPWGQQPLAALTFVLRASGDPGALVPAVERTLFAIDSRVGIARAGTMTQLLDAQLRERQVLLLLLGAFAGLAVLLACVGVTGVMSQAVSERSREIGVRLALGATPGAIRRAMLGDALSLATRGILVGGVVAVAGTRLLRAFLFEVSPVDVVGFGGAVALLLALVVLAALGPCVRATRVDPARVLQ